MRRTRRYEMIVLLSEACVHLQFAGVCFLSTFSLGTTSDPSGALTLPSFSGDLSTMEGLHKALTPAWESLVENRNMAGMVEAKDEGKPVPPMSKEETAFQFERVQKGQVDSARLLLVYGMVPSTGNIDEKTKELLLQEKAREEERKKAAEEGAAEGEEEAESDGAQSNLPAVADPNLVYPDGSTPLHMAATFGLAGTARALIDAGADVQATAKTGVLPLHGAAIMGHVGLVELLVEGRADIDAPHGFAGNTAIHFAAEMGHPEVVRRLCELGADVEAEKLHGGTALHITADTNNSEVTRVLVNEPCNADMEAEMFGDTVALYLAAGRGFPKVIDVLLEAGANPDRSMWKRPGGKKKKKKKAKKDKPQASTALIAKANPAHFIPGSDPSSPGWEQANGATPLHNAAENGHASACQALLDGGARQLSVMQGATPLVQAIHYRHPDVAIVLLDHRTPANVASVSPRDGQTSLHAAAAYDYPELVARILRQGGTHQVQDRRGLRPIEYARGRETQWLLSKFIGREPKLDLIVRKAYRPGGEKEESLVEQLLKVPLEGINKDSHEAYLQFARLKANDTLEEHVAYTTQRVAEGNLDKEKRAALMQGLSIATSILMGSDAYTAVQALMRNETKSVHVGLALMGVKVKTLKYKPHKVMRINGHDVFERVNSALSSAVHGGDWETFLHEMDLLRQDSENDFLRRTEKASVSSPASEGAGAKDSGDDVEDHLEL